MKFLALIHNDEARWAALDEEERAAWYGRYRTFAEDARGAGVLLGGDELASTRDATTVRVRGDETLVTDGPYAEVKEALGGYYLLECPSLEDAIDWAARIPGSEHGAVEVRLVHEDPEDMPS